MKRLLVILMAALLLAAATACKKTEEEPVPEEIAATAIPVATTEPVVIEMAQPTPAPANLSESLKNLVISDADVDAVMMEDVDGWDGYSVLSVEYDGQTLFYVIPDEFSLDETTAVGTVVMNYDTNKVNALSCQIHLNQAGAYPAQVEKLYNYFKDEFPLVAIGNLQAEIWQGLQTQLDMSYASATAAAASGTETRELCGQFVFHVAKELVSFDFYVG